MCGRADRERLLIDEINEQMGIGGAAGLNSCAQALAPKLLHPRRSEP